jgi:hypothetical protein
MKSVIEKALDNVKKLNVQELDEPKPQKPSKNEIEAIPYDPRPTIYLDDKELPMIGRYKAGDKVILVCECSVRSISAYDRLEGKEAKKSTNCDLVIESIADITQE